MAEGFVVLLASILDIRSAAHIDQFALLFLTETVAVVGPIVSASRYGLLITRVVIISVCVLNAGAWRSLNCRRDQLREILVYLRATNEMSRGKYLITLGGSQCDDSCGLSVSKGGASSGRTWIFYFRSLCLFCNFVLLHFTFLR